MNVMTLKEFKDYLATLPAAWDDKEIFFVDLHMPYGSNNIDAHLTKDACIVIQDAV